MTRLFGQNFSSYQGGGFAHTGLWSSGEDYECKYGASSLQDIAYGFIARKFIEGQPVMQVAKGQADSSDEEWEVSPKQPLMALLKSPNDFGGLVKLMADTAIDLSRGNAYWVLGRSASGKIVNIWWMPKDFIQPFCSANNDGYPVAYQVNIGGQIDYLQMQDVVHFQGLLSDPRSPFTGRDPLGSQYRHIQIDHEIAEYSHAIVKNMGIPGAVFTAKDFNEILSNEAAAEVKRRYGKAAKGVNRGDALILDVPYDVTFPSVSPDNMAIEELGDTPEERVPAALGLNAMALQLGAGLKRSTFNNYEEAVKAAFENGIAPLHRLVALQVTEQLVPEFGGDPNRVRLWFDYKDIPSLQEDRNLFHTRIREDWKANGLRLGQFQQKCGYDVDADKEDMYFADFAAAPSMGVLSIDSGQGQGTPVEGTTVAPPVAQLNGAQITAAIDVIAKLQEGSIGEVTAIKLLVAVGLLIEDAEAMVNDSKDKTPAETVADNVVPANTPEDPAAPGAKTAKERRSAKPVEFKEVGPDSVLPSYDENIVHDAVARAIPEMQQLMLAKPVEEGKE